MVRWSETTPVGVVTDPITIRLWQPDDYRTNATAYALRSVFNRLISKNTRHATAAAITRVIDPIHHLDCCKIKR